MKNLYGVILAGGSGTRLWPISRELYPKQLLKIFGNKTLIQQTFARLKKIIDIKNIYVVTGDNFSDDIYFQLRGLGFERSNIITESARKNTAPAIALASKTIYDRNKSAVVLTCPADHLIRPDSEFLKNVKTAVRIAKKDFLITFGIIPEYPSPEYGYIKSDTGKKRAAFYTANKFVEKPSIKEAEELIRENSFWNSGIFVWKAKAVLNEIKKNLPNVYKAVHSDSQKKYSSLEPISIDKGVLEISDKVAVVPASFKWQDIGSWKSLHELLPKNRDNNFLAGKVLDSGCKNCLIYGNDKRVVVAIGLDDMVVVDTEDAVLVSHKEKTQDIKKIFDRMKSGNFPQHLQHPTIFRPWGSFTVIEEGEGFKVKKITVNPKQRTSLQTHGKRSEHWIVLKGLARVKLNDNIIYLRQHQSIDIPVGAKHSLENTDKILLEIIEIQNGNYLGEDDIIRIEDKYKRKAKIV